MKEPQEQFQRIRRALLGQKPWRVQEGFGSFIVLDFGKESKEVSKNGTEHTFGEWHIWIYCCEWEITDKLNSPLVHSESPREEIAEILDQIKDSVLVALDYNPEPFKLDLRFENGFSIKLIPENEFFGDAEYMMIFTPDHYVLSFCPQKILTYEASNKVPS